MIDVPQLHARGPVGFLMSLQPAGAAAPFRWTTLGAPVEVGGQRYEPAPVLGDGGFARMSSTLTRAAFEMRISDPEWAVRDQMESIRGAQGAALTVSIHADGAALPLRSAVCVAAADGVDADGRTLTLRFCNPLARLGDSRPRRVDPASQREFDLNDTAFDHATDKFTFVFGYHD